MQHKRDQFIYTLRKYAPIEFVGYLVDCILDAKVRFKIVARRKTKLGDFRLNAFESKPVITVNGDLNPYSFLITALHELAHLDTFRAHGHTVEPHGKEWKMFFAKRLKPILESKKLPLPLQEALEKSILKIKASSCSDIQLSRVLKTYDEHQETFLEQLPFQAEFILKDKRFIKGELRRTRYLCTEKSSKRIYLIHALAPITPILYD